MREWSELLREIILDWLDNSAKLKRKWVRVAEKTIRENLVGGYRRLELAPPVPALRDWAESWLKARDFKVKYYPPGDPGTMTSYRGAPVYEVTYTKELK